ncbi:DUF4860 domain-containing protein [Butyrivibrio sp. AE3003]|uniref:DUF4860 domain-containing protein n=1 Tax=Butyrivibrio sp. AE3003 TaxID=1496721 RepID=UPI00047D18D0|nr:DUF4860 domain-containing protein [Butyrivibrio sp. AE3003]
MDFEGTRSHIIDMVFVICLMFLFIFSALSVITIGANIYQKNVTAVDDNYHKRTACAYITEKVRQSDVNGGIFIKKIFDQNALVLQNEEDGILYNTYIYDYEGNLMELFAMDELKDLYPQTGQKILELTKFDIEYVGDDTLSVYVILKDGTEESFLVKTKSVSEE